jgi:hypothetical protein
MQILVAGRHRGRRDKGAGQPDELVASLKPENFKTELLIINNIMILGD